MQITAREYIRDAAMQKIFEIRNFSYRYAGQSIKALDQIDLTVFQGDVVIVKGRNGEGKSTLLKAMLGVVPSLLQGESSGQVLFRGEPVSRVGVGGLAGRIGAILSDPDAQITNLTVADEVIFGLESLGLPKTEILDRASAALKLVGLSEFGARSPYSLSGGYKQRLSIASVFAMGARVLLLDDPLIGLDAACSSGLLATISSLIAEVDAIVIASSTPEAFMSLATRVVTMEGGQVRSDIVVEQAEIHRSISTRPSASLRSILFRGPEVQDSPTQVNTVALQRVSYSPTRTGHLTLRDLTIDFRRGQSTSIIGPNGSGKSTVGLLASGLRQPSEGTVERNANKIAFVFQNPTAGFIADTVHSELLLSAKGSKERVGGALEKFDLARLAKRSPFALSEGEKRRVSVVSALLREPDLLILDEATAGIDSVYSADLLSEITAMDLTTIYMTHDIDIVYHHSHSAVVLSDGVAVYQGEPRRIPVEYASSILGVTYL